MWRGGRVLILVAHPDDETLAFGGEMEHWPDAVIVHTTDGSPAKLSDAQSAGFADREEYAAARRAELDAALALVGGRENRCLGITDQHSWHDLKGLTVMVRNLIEEIRPEAVLTHPYEGGHPDHDASAFAVQCSCHALGADAPLRIEGAFYNACKGFFEPNNFIPGPAETVVKLAPEVRVRKEGMLARFASQQRVLWVFDRSMERFRHAPFYDFGHPPHAGKLNYETLGWGITSAMWIEAANRARAGLSG